MNPNLLEEYKAYYAARARRYENNSNYQHTYASEKALSNAMDSCNELEEFKDKIGNLNEKCASALVKDEHLMEHKFYQQHQETVRAKAAEQILQRIDDCSDVTELMSMVQEVMNENSLDISMDEWQREFQGDWSQLDAIEVYRNAEVPDKYKADMTRIADQTQQRMKQSVVDSKMEARKFQPNFEFDHDLNMEHRHKRLLPYQDDHIREQIANYKNRLNS